MTIARTFCVQARDFAGRRVLTEANFEAAAVAFVEHFAPSSDETDFTVIVRDADSGHEHCFRIDLEKGVIAACD